MKIYSAINKTNYNTKVNNLQNKSRVEAQKPDQIDVIKKQNKINVPQDFQYQAKLNKDEQNFFEKLYPKAKKEIRQYMQNQNQVSPEKGKYIDVRG